MFRITIFLMLLMCTSGCSYPPRDDPEAKPSPAEMFGTYQASDKSKLVKGFKAEGTLALNADMTFVMNNLSGTWPRNSTLGYEKTWSGAGKWDIREHTALPGLSRYVIYLTFEYLNGKQLSTPGNYVTITSQIGIGGEKPPYYLITSVGSDPDDGYFLKLEKIKD